MPEASRGEWPLGVADDDRAVVSELFVAHELGFEGGPRCRSILGGWRCAVPSLSVRPIAYRSLRRPSTIVSHAAAHSLDNPARQRVVLEVFAVRAFADTCVGLGSSRAGQIRLGINGPPEDVVALLDTQVAQRLRDAFFARSRDVIDRTTFCGRRQAHQEIDGDVAGAVHEAEDVRPFGLWEIRIRAATAPAGHPIDDLDPVGALEALGEWAREGADRLAQPCLTVTRTSQEMAGLSTLRPRSADSGCRRRLRSSSGGGQDGSAATAHRGWRLPALKCWGLPSGAS